MNMTLSGDFPVSQKQRKYMQKQYLLYPKCHSDSTHYSGNNYFYRIHIFIAFCIKSWNSENKNNFQSNTQYICIQYYLQQNILAKRSKIWVTHFTVVELPFFLFETCSIQKPSQRSDHQANSGLSIVQRYQLEVYSQ